MKKRGILNPHLARLVTNMGHGDMILIGDRGLPFPLHCKTDCIDLSVKPGQPGVIDVLEAVLEELEVESMIFSDVTNK